MTVIIQDSIYTSSAAVCSMSAAGISRDVSSDAGILCNKAAVLGDMIKETLCIIYRYSDWLRAGLSGDRIPVAARFSAPVQTGPGAHPASCKMGTGSFLGVKSGRDVTLTPHPLVVPWS